MEHMDNTTFFILSAILWTLVALVVRRQRKAGKR